MKKILVISAVIAALFSISGCASKKGLGEPQAVMAEIGKPGTVVVQVWSYSKTPNIEDEKVFENAVKCLVFYGIGPNESRRMNGRPALAPNANENNSDYFDSFFANKDYLPFCSIGMKGYVEQGNLLKTKKGYKIGKIVVVRYDQLRNKLVSDGIIRGLNSGF